MKNENFEKLWKEIKYLEKLDKFIEKNEWMYLKILAITNTTHKQFKEEFLKYCMKDLK